MGGWIESLFGYSQFQINVIASAARSKETAISMATCGNATKKDFLLLVLPARRKVGVRMQVLVESAK